MGESGAWELRVGKGKEEEEGHAGGSAETEEM